MLDRFRPRLTYANVASTLALVLAMGGSAYAAINSIPGPDGVIHGCYKKQKGNLRVVPAGKTCAKSERPLAFNQQGPQGPQGPSGLTGQSGPSGTAGTPGTPGSPGAPGTARAYAHVLAGASPSLVPAYTKGFTAVSNAFVGGYCLTPAAGVNPSSYPAVAVGEWGDSGGAAPYLAMVRNSASDCAAGQYEVITFQGTSPAPSNGVAFNIIVP